MHVSCPILNYHDQIKISQLVSESEKLMKLNSPYSQVDENNCDLSGAGLLFHYYRQVDLLTILKKSSL